MSAVESEVSVKVVEQSGETEEKMEPALDGDVEERMEPALDDDDVVATDENSGCSDNVTDTRRSHQQDSMCEVDKRGTTTAVNNVAQMSARKRHRQRVSGAQLLSSLRPRNVSDEKQINVVCFSKAWECPPIFWGFLCIINAVIFTCHAVPDATNQGC